MNTEFKPLCQVETAFGKINIEICEDDRTYDRNLPNENWLLECEESIQHKKFDKIETREELLDLIKSMIDLLDYSGWLLHPMKDKR